MKVRWQDVQCARSMPYQRWVQPVQVTGNQVGSSLATIAAYGRQPTERARSDGQAQATASFPSPRPVVSGLGEFSGISPVLVIGAGPRVQLTDLVGVLGETAEVADRDPALELAASTDGDAGGGSAAAAVVVTVLDRFLAAGLSREAFDAHLAAGRIAVAGQRVTDPAMPAPHPMAVAITLDPGEAGEGYAARA